MLIIDEELGRVVVSREGREEAFPMDSPEAFEAVSRAWLRVGWDVKYVYSFTWLGRPVIQLPEDLIRIQEVIYQVRPTVLIETGIAHGGSLVFYASLFEVLGEGRVIGVDVEIRPHNREALESHPLYHRISLIEGDSIAEQTVSRVRSLAGEGETVMVVLDGNHSKAHVSRELELYGPMVTPGSCIVACDGIRELVAGGPRTSPDWQWNHPKAAAIEFTQTRAEFEIREPKWLFNEGRVRERVTYWPSAFVWRKP